MKEQFLPYELALKLKDLGFDEQCIAGYQEYGEGIILMLPRNIQIFRIDDLGYKKYGHQNNHVVKAPLWQQALDWFREIQGLHSSIDITTFGDWYYGVYNLKEEGNIEVDPFDNITIFKTYQEARAVCLGKLIETVKNESE